MALSFVGKVKLSTFACIFLLRTRRAFDRCVYIDDFIESALYGFLFTSYKTLENERVSAANE